MMDKKIQEESVIVTIVGPDNEEKDYVQETVIPFMGKKFVILVAIPETEDGNEELDMILARMDEDEFGEIEYLPPTDEEYDAVISIYDAM